MLHQLYLSSGSWLELKMKPYIPRPSMFAAKLLMLLLAGGFQVSSTDVLLASRQTVLTVAAAADEAPYPVCPDECEGRQNHHTRSKSIMEAHDHKRGG